MDTLKQFDAARRVSVPLIIWKTPDAAATMSGVKARADYPLLSWDVVRGVVAVNELGKGKMAPAMGEEGVSVGQPMEMLAKMADLAADSVMFMHNAHLFTADGSGASNGMVVQAIWNLRDSNKADHKTLVMLTPQMKTPMELSNDILVLDEPLPNESELKAIVEGQVKSAKAAVHGTEIKFNAPDVDKAVDAISGLSAFAAEQAVAVSFEKNGDGVRLNPTTLWERKVQAIEETRGLTVWREGETLDDVKGCENVKNFAKMVIGGRIAPRVVVFLDEIEKQFAGIAGDTSGTSQDQHMQFLTEMQNKKYQGMILVGPPGSAKSMFAKAFGATAGIPTVQMDVGAMKGSLVGESEKYIREAFKVIAAVSQGRALFIATCNKITGLPPELKRRFTLGTFYFDLPTWEERIAIWTYYIKKFDLKAKVKDVMKALDEEGWTGADIFGCCYRAWMFNCSLGDAARYATPVCKTDPAGIEALRKLANNAFISANYEGLYQIGKQTVALGGQRKMEFK